jgi:hypothetical protein
LAIYYAVPGVFGKIWAGVQSQKHRCWPGGLMKPWLFLLCRLKLFNPIHPVQRTIPYKILLFMRMAAHAIPLIARSFAFVIKAIAQFAHCSNGLKRFLGVVISHRKVLWLYNTPEFRKSPI